MSERTPAPTAQTDADQNLLRTFARSGDEAAFRQIVDRYAGFVKAVGRRTTGSVDLAEETAQAVFAVLARKAASVARTDHLVGWLHRTTVFDALRRARSETRHRRKLAVFATAMTRPADEPPPAWLDALPLVDSALQRLRESERRVLIMRYFEGRSYGGIAEVTGKSEAAAKKQTARALDRLRVLIHRRGAVCSTAGLAGILAAQISAHASVTAPQLAANALRAAPHLTWKTLALHSLHLMNTSKLIGAAALIVLCAVPLAWQERAIAAARRDVDSLERIQPHTPRAAVAKPAPFTRPPSASAPAPVIMDIEQVAKDVESAQVSGPLIPRTAEATREAKARLESIDAPALSTLLEDVLNLSGGPRRQAMVEYYLFDRLGKIAPLLGIRAAPRLLHRGLQSSHAMQVVVSMMLSALVKEDPDAALREFHALRESDGLEGKGAGSTSYVAYGKFVGQLFAVRLDEATSLYATLDLGGRLNALSDAAALDSAEVRRFVLAEIPKFEPRWQQSMFETMLASELKRNGLDGAAALFKELQLPPDPAVETITSFLSDTNRGRAGAHVSIADRLNWLRQQLPPDQFAKAGGLFLGKTPEFSSEHLQESRNREFRAYDWGANRDEAIAALFKPLEPPDNAAEALSLALEIRNDAMRMDTLCRLARRFKESPASYKAALEASTALTPEEKSQILQP